MTTLTFDELNSMIDPYNDDMLIRTLFNLSVEGKDKCSQCEEICDIVTCNKCGDAVCIKTTCSNLFPHHKNTIFAVCYRCSKEISDKMNLVIDMGKLSSIKNKVKMRQNSSENDEKLALSK